jgi:hypothetical protein
MESNTPEIIRENDKGKNCPKSIEIKFLCGTLFSSSHVALVIDVVMNNELFVFNAHLIKYIF